MLVYFKLFLVFFLCEIFSSVYHFYVRICVGRFFTFSTKSFSAFSQFASLLPSFIIIYFVCFLFWQRQNEYFIIIFFFCPNFELFYFKRQLISVDMYIVLHTHTGTISQIHCDIQDVRHVYIYICKNCSLHEAVSHLKFFKQQLLAKSYPRQIIIFLNECTCNRKKLFTNFYFTVKLGSLLG